MNDEKIFKIKSKYLLNGIFSFIKYEKALNLMKYNKILQNKLNITKNDYSIDCIFKKELVDKESGELMINNETDERNSFLSSSIIIFQIIFIVCSIININYWKISFYNVYLIFDIVYKAVVIFYLMMKKFWNIKDDCLPIFQKCDIFFNSIILIILICKIISDRKDNNNKNILLILNSIMISICIIIIILLIINSCFCYKESKVPGLIKKTYKVEVNTAIIKKFRGFNVNEFKMLPLISFGSLTSEEINCLLMNDLIYSLTDNQLELINLINKLRKVEYLEELKYNVNQKLYDFFIHIKRFYSIDNINKISDDIYLFIYPKCKFKTLILEENDKIMKILYKYFLNHILILEKNNNEYILIFDSNNNLRINEINESNKETERKDLLKLNSKKNWLNEDQFLEEIG